MWWWGGRDVWGWGVVGRAFTPLVVGTPSLLTAVLSPRSSLLTLTRGRGGGGGGVTYLPAIRLSR